ncbi:MAG: CPBP family intramembrane metalloprotease [Roseobacter sp.]|nr:CPBP family intramembrane metalloprotease [Roseobacter sp.]
MRRAPYAAHRAFIAPADLSGTVLTVGLGYCLIELGYYLTYDLIEALLLALQPDWIAAFFAGSTPLGLGAQLASFGLLAVLVALVVRRLHHRPARTLIGPPRLALRQFCAVLAPLGLLLLVLEFVPPWWSADALHTVRAPLTWGALLPLSLGAVFVQIAAEELLYRGYLQQQLATLFEHPASWLLLTNLAFGFAHWSAASPLTTNLQYVIWAFCFGLAASDLTARAGTLGPALAFHFANNAFAFLLYGEAGGPSSGFALFLFAPETLGEPFTSDAPAGLDWRLALELLLLGLMWLAARIGLKR